MEKISENYLKQEPDEDFERFQTKVDEVVKILSMMNSSNKSEESKGCELADKFLGNDKEYLDKLHKNDFIVCVKQDRTVINHRAGDDEDDEIKPDGSAMGKRAFMTSVERDAAHRAKERKEREAVAKNLRKLGNQAFHQEEYEKAINLYTKALDQIKDNYVVYNNRALSYIKIGLMKRAIIDCDFVLQKLDEKNIRSWLYRGYAYYLLGETNDYEKSINEARKNNPKELDFIDKVVEFISNSTTNGGNVMTVELESL